MLVLVEVIVVDVLVEFEVDEVFVLVVELVAFVK